MNEFMEKKNEMTKQLEELMSTLQKERETYRQGLEDTENKYIHEKELMRREVCNASK